MFVLIEGLPPESCLIPPSSRHLGHEEDRGGDDAHDESDKSSGHVGQADGFGPEGLRGLVQEPVRGIREVKMSVSFLRKNSC